METIQSTFRGTLITVAAVVMIASLTGDNVIARVAVETAQTISQTIATTVPSYWEAWVTAFTDYFPPEAQELRGWKAVSSPATSLPSLTNNHSSRL